MGVPDGQVLTSIRTVNEHFDAIAGRETATAPPPPGAQGIRVNPAASFSEHSTGGESAPAALAQSNTRGQAKRRRKSNQPAAGASSSVPTVAARPPSLPGTHTRILEQIQDLKAKGGVKTRVDGYKIVLRMRAKGADKGRPYWTVWPPGHPKKETRMRVPTRLHAHFNALEAARAASE